MSKVDKTGVHASHCCNIHGCKYGEDDTCPVTTLQVEPMYLCEECYDYTIMNDTRGELPNIIETEIWWSQLTASQKQRICNIYRKINE